MVYNVIISLVYTSVADRHFNWYCTELIDFGPMLRLRTWVWTGLGTWLWFLKWILNFLRNLVWNFENSVFINFFITDSNPWQLSTCWTRTPSWALTAALFDHTLVLTGKNCYIKYLLPYLCSWTPKFTLYKSPKFGELMEYTWYEYTYIYAYLVNIIKTHMHMPRWDLERMLLFT